MKSTRLIGLMFATMVLLAQAVQAAIIADSVADFSGTQGASGWTYNTTAGGGAPLGNFINAPAYGLPGTNPHWSDPAGDVPPFTKLWASGGHPGTDGDAVRRYTSAINGPLTISGTYQKLDNGGGDGSVVSILKNGSSLGSFAVANNTPIGTYSFNVPAVIGDQFDFKIGSGSSGNVFFDATTFTSTIATRTAINMNFASGPDPAAGGSSVPYDLAPSDVAGLPAVADDHWNNLHFQSGTMNNLLDGDGANSGATVTWNSNGTYETAINQNTSPDFMMMKSHLDARASGFGDPTDATVTVSSLPAVLADHLYDVYVYFDAVSSNGAVLSNYTIGSQTFYIQDTSTFNGTFVQGTGTTAGTRTAGANYVVFRNLTGSSFTLLADSESFRAEISGIQVVSVPEPSAAMLLILGLTGFAGRRLWKRG